MIDLFLKWRARIAPAFSARPGVDIFGQVLPFNERLETIAARYNVWRAGPTDDDRSLARRTALTICESIERQSQVSAALEHDLEVVLTFDQER